MRLLFVIAFVLSACHHTCPVSIPPPPVVTVAKSPPCDLPTLPQAFHLVGMPDAQRIYVTKDDLADLGRYLVGLQAWVVAASGCLVGATP